MSCTCEFCSYHAMTYEEPPQWTTDPPTEAGHYWAQRKHRKTPEPVFFELDDDPDWRVFVVGEDVGRNVDDFTHWMRIETPESPK